MSALSTILIKSSSRGREKDFLLGDGAPIFGTDAELLKPSKLDRSLDQDMTLILCERADCIRRII